MKVTGDMGIIDCDLTINGGQVEFSSLGGNVNCYNVVLGVNKPTDYIKIDNNHCSISGFIKVADGLVLKDENGNLYSGTLKEAYTYEGSDMLNGKTLVPVTKTLTLPTDITGGTVTADKTGDVIVGKTVTLTVSPDDGYAVKSVTVNGEPLEPATGVYSFEMPNEDVTVSSTFTMVGDVNLDGYVDIRDATMIQKHLVQLVTLSDAQLIAADTNGDGEVNISDATHLRMYLAQFNVVLGS